MILDTHNLTNDSGIILIESYSYTLKKEIGQYSKGRYAVTDLSINDYFNCPISAEGRLIPCADCPKQIMELCVNSERLDNPLELFPTFYTEHPEYLL